MSLNDPKTKNILIIDDDPAQISVMEQILQKAGFQVTTASNGDEARTKLSALKPDLITVDLIMPGMGGLEFIRYLQSEGLSSVPVIIITGRYNDKLSSDEQILRMEPNVVDFIKKPIRPTLFIFRIHQLLKTDPMAGKS
jgi:CheY-like chemotaxis protein